MKKYLLPTLIVAALLVPMIAGAQMNIFVGFNEMGNAAGYGNAELGTAVGRMINIALSILGLVATVLIIVGGFQWMMSGGNEEAIGKAKKLMIAGVVGLVIVLLAWAISKFLITRIANVAM